MASIIKEILIDADADEAWAALRDFGGVHQRLVPGFVVACTLDGPETRVVTFFNGAVARELLVGIDDDARRLAYTVIEGPLDSTHHNASAQVVPTDDDRIRFVWTTDVLPDAVTAMVSELMDRGIAVIKQTLESQSARSRS
jgi:hypothetical protein